MKRRFVFNRFWQGSLVAVALAVGLVACAPYTIHRHTHRGYPRIVVPNLVKCYTDDMPSQGAIWLATVDSGGATTTSATIRAGQLEQLRRAASRVGAEAVYGVRQMTRRTRGLVGDPYTPFPSLMQGWNQRYFLRGEAMLSEGRLTPKRTRFRHPNPLPE